MFSRKSLALLCLALSSTHMIGASGLHRSPIPAGKIVGRWDVTIQEANGGQYPSWFEVTGEGGVLTGRFVGSVGSQRPIKTIDCAKAHLAFSLPIQFERHKTDLKFEANLIGERLE